MWRLSWKTFLSNLILLIWLNLNWIDFGTRGKFYKKFVLNDITEKIITATSKAIDTNIVKLWLVKLIFLESFNQSNSLWRINLPETYSSEKTSPVGLHRLSLPSIHPVWRTSLFIQKIHCIKVRPVFPQLRQKAQESIVEQCLESFSWRRQCSSHSWRWFSLAFQWE